MDRLTMGPEKGRDASKTSNLDCLGKMTAAVRESQFKVTASDQGTDA